MTADCNLDELRAIVSPIAKKYGVERISLFGSRARGDCTPESDYDFCITPKKDMSLVELSGLRLDLMDALGSDVDIVCEKYIKSDFMKYISGDRRILYEI